jgi:hypothetical protein
VNEKPKPKIYLTVINDGEAETTEIEKVPTLETIDLSQGKVIYITVVHPTHFWMRFYKNELYFRSEHNFGTF